MVLTVCIGCVLCGLALLSLLGNEREQELRRVQDDVKRAAVLKLAQATAPDADAKKVGR